MGKEYKKKVCNIFTLTAPPKSNSRYRQTTNQNAVIPLPLIACKFEVAARGLHVLSTMLTE